MTHKILISPAQRFALLNLTHSESNKIPDGNAGRRYRRFMRAFGVHHIGLIMREHGGVRGRWAGDERTRHLIEADDEAVEYAIMLSGRERNALAEDILGPLFDTLDNIKAERYDEPAEGEPLDIERDSVQWLPEGVAPPAGKLVSLPAS